MVDVRVGRLARGYGPGGHGAKSFGVTFPFLDWSGKKLFASRAGRFFIVGKGDHAPSDVRCSADPFTGLSPQADVSACRAYVTHDLRLKDGTGQNVTIGIARYPGLHDAAPEGVPLRQRTRGLRDRRRGLPPALDRAGPRIRRPDRHDVPEHGHVRPAGEGEPRIQRHTFHRWDLHDDGRRRAPGGPSIRRSRSTWPDVLTITSPNSMTVQVGVPFSFHVQATGVPPLTIQTVGGLFLPFLARPSSTTATERQP